jgi:phospholipase C
MPSSNRRDFLKATGGGATMLALQAMIDRAMAVPANRRTGSIADVGHVVIHMQENRSFDHYFGVLNGVRGLGDPRPLRLPGGRSVWAQPSAQHADGFVLPFHGDSRTSRSFMIDGADQSHQENVHIYNRGRYDRWGHTGEMQNRMLHFGPGDLPFYYALADAFTVCDAYHSATMTQTYPNRFHLFSGCNGGGGVGGDPEMSNYGEEQSPVSDMARDTPLHPDAYRWTSYAERLHQAGIDWKVYQEYDNFNDNVLALFPPFRSCPRDSELYRRARAWVSEHKAEPDRTRSDGEQLVAAFRHDVESGKLPQVSWIVTSTDLSEHPTGQPGEGEKVTAGLIGALVDNPEVFARTVFLLLYDEAGGFYDHALPPVPPVGTYRGHSTVPVTGEAKHYPGDDHLTPGTHPIGLGIRTPAVIVSPWTRGGFVCSQLFDHTSVIRFMEQRFGVAEPNISAWRRSVCGDLTSAFDFSAGSDQPPRIALPATADVRARIARSRAGSAVTIPGRQGPTAQIPGQRPHRPLPYDFTVAADMTASGRLRVDMTNRGKVGVCLTVHDNLDRNDPWHFTIGAGDAFSHEAWFDPAVATDYDLTVRGPNGFYRRYAGAVAATGLAVDAQPRGEAIAIALVNRGPRQADVLIAMDPRYPVAGERRHRIAIAPGQSMTVVCALGPSDNWYDLTVSDEGLAGFSRRFAGKVESGRPGKTDPGIGSMQVWA